MDELIRISEKLTAILSNWDQWTDKFLHKFDPDFIDINREQMLAGEQADGDIIGQLRSPEYIGLKKSIGSKSAPLMDFKLTGSFQDKMTIDNAFNISSTDEKTPKLTNLAPNVFGIQDKRLDEFANDQILPELIDEILKELGL